MAETVTLAGTAKTDLSTHILDITNKPAVEAFPEQVIARHGSVDGLINNAGIIQPFVKLIDLVYADIDRVMQINFYGALYMIKAFLPLLIKRPEAHIINISSMGGFLPVPGQTIYGASKAAIKLMTEGLHSELRDTAIKVTAVFPGAMNTEIAKNSGATASLKIDASQQTYKSIEPDKAARQILDGMENNLYHVLIGSDAKLMDFLYRLSPQRAAGIIYKQMRSLLQN